MGQSSGDPLGTEGCSPDRSPASPAKDNRCRRANLKDAVRKALRERQEALETLVDAVKEYKRLATHPESIRGSEYAQAIHALGKALDLAERLIQD